MPGRTSTRTTRTTRTAAGTKSARSSIIEIPDEGPVTSLRTRIVQVFSDAQKTTATQRKLVVTLRKIQEECCFEPPPTAKKGKKAQEEEEEEFDEKDFNHEIARNLLRVMNVKKSEAAGDRVIRFLAMFLKHASEKDYKNSAVAMEDDDEGGQEPTNRLNRHIITVLVRLLPSKDKTVRFRATQTLTTLLNSLQLIDNDLFTLIRMGLTKRLRDKEASVRVQAVMGLGRLSGDDDEEDEEDSDDEAGTILDKLVTIMSSDPDAQVRRTILANIPTMVSTLHFKLERARDMDPATRRYIYTKLLPTMGDFRLLSLVEREKIIRWGLRDRDDAVRKAAARLFYERWIEDCAGKRDTRPEEEKVRDATAPPSREALCELLERIDIVNAGAEGGMAHEAMKQFWAGRPDYLEAMTFDHDFWLNLDPPAAFMVRTLNDYAQNTDDDRIRELIEEKMLDITQFTVILKKELNNVTAVLRKDALLNEDDPEADEMGELLQDSMFVTEQLLHVSLTLDFSDEMGRRQMYSITREAIADPALPEECTKLAIEVLRVVCGNRGESDFCAVVMEAIQDVRDTLLDDDEDETTEVVDDAESFHSAQSEHSSPPPANKKAAKPTKDLSPEEEEEKQIRETSVHSKCLHLVQCTLQNVTCNLESNTNLTSMLNTLIIPAVQSRDNNVIREQGIICLGVAALLSSDLAASNLDLFFHCFSRGHDALKEIVLQILSDVIITHPHLLAPPAADPDTTEQSELPEQNPLLKPLVKMLLRGIASDNVRVAQIACEAAQKLVFHGLLPVEAIEEIVKFFTLKYFDPDTDHIPAVRQGLAYFLPVFCHSKIKNAQLMAGIAVPIISRLLVIRDEIEEDEDAEMVGWPAITAHLSDWTDGRKVVGQTEAGLDGKVNLSVESELPHLALAVDILERALTSTCSKDERKPLLSLLSKLHISATAPNPKEGGSASHELLETLQGLVSEAVEERIGVDATQRNALAKLDATLTKRLGDAANATVVQGDREDTVTPETAKTSETPAEEPRASVARSSVAPSVDGSEMDVDEDDTMLAGMQAEGTRMPLEADESDDDNESTPRAPRARATREATEKTEADIMDELLASDEEMTM
ncbi:nuclear condensin complex subunit [Stagonosporopsis vannaccii]|nr:nuclear condensin complex subunit [Stagonosporopsis vannaccii]